MPTENLSDPEKYRERSIAEFTGKFQLKTRQRLNDLEQEVVGAGSPNLLYDFVMKIRYGSGVKTIARLYGLSPSTVFNILKAADISYPNNAEAVQRNWANPQFRQKIKDTNGPKLKARWQDPDFRQSKISASSNRYTKLWQDPEYRARQIPQATNNIQNPSARKKAVETRKQRIRDDKVFRERMAEVSRRNIVLARLSPEYLVGRERMWQNPDFRRRNAEASRRNLERLRQDPGFVQRQSERAREQMLELWQTPGYRDRINEIVSQRNILMWQNPDFRGRMTAIAHDQMIQAWQDPEYRARMTEVIRSARIGLQNRDVYVTPTNCGYRSDIDYYALSAWEANIARILMYVGRNFAVGRSIPLNVAEEFSSLFTEDITYFELDFVTTTPRGNIATYEIMAHPQEDPEGWAKFIMSQQQYPELNIRAITERLYLRLQRRFRRAVENDPRFHGWENKDSNLRRNPELFTS